MTTTNTGPGRPPIGPRYEVRLPDTLKAAVDAYASSRGITFADAVRDILNDRFAPASAGLPERIRDAYNRLATRNGDLVGVIQIRAALPDVDHDTLTNAIADLHFSQVARLLPEENRRSITAEDRAAAVTIGDEDRHLIAFN